MGDIDFDELDKAVNSLMEKREQANSSDTAAIDSQKSDTEADLSTGAEANLVDSKVETGTNLELEDVSTTDTDSESVLDRASDQESGRDDVSDLSRGVIGREGIDSQDAESSSGESSEAELGIPERPAIDANRPASLATRRRGKFMDVIRPSERSDIAPVEAPSRQGVTLEPIGQAGEVKPDVTPTPTPTPTPSAVADESPASDEELNSLLGKIEDIGSQDIVDDSVASNEASAEPDSLASPFLPDAKVEKRPLGMSESSEDIQQDDSPVEAEDLTQDQSSPAEDGPKLDQFESTQENKPEVSLPEELGNELVSLESGSSTEGKPALSSSSDAPMLSPALASRTPIESVNTDTDDEAEASIFDTAGHDGLATQSSERSAAWQIAAILIGMAAIGVLGGAVYYYFVVMR